MRLVQSRDGMADCAPSIGFRLHQTRGSHRDESPYRVLAVTTAVPLVRDTEVVEGCYLDERDHSQLVPLVVSI